MESKALVLFSEGDNDSGVDEQTQGNVRNSSLNLLLKLRF